MADTVQQIKEKLSVIDVVSPYVKLQKAGKYWKGLSPFNKEKTPSFFVNPERGTYYCFSSNQGGDLFTFIEKMEGVDFKGALKILADKAGVEIVYEGRGKDTKEIDRLREVVARAEAFFARELHPDIEAYRYAVSRGLAKETIASWNLGCAPSGWRTLLEALVGEGVTTAELVRAGLVKEADEKKGTYYDRFRNRLMFPIRDAAGRTVAFTGRALDKNDQAKYLNSPETELFKKSQLFFGMDRAKDAIRARGFALLVEGQFYLILLHQIGFTNTIALSGTALSREHLSLLSRYTENLMLALDADRAGLAASAKSAHAALSAGLRVKAVRLPLGKDPADLAKDTPKDFARRVSEAEPIVEFFLSVLSAAEKDPHRLILSAERIVLPLIAAMKSPLEREHFVTVTARMLASTPEAVRASLMRAKSEPTEATEDERGRDAQVPARVSPLARRGTMLTAILQCYPGSVLAKRVESEYARITGTPPPEEDLPEAVLFEAGLAFGEDPDEDAADDLLRAFEHASLTAALSEASERLRQGEAGKDEQGIAEALAECKTISTRLSAL